jgi:hypothetical protein
MSFRRRTGIVLVMGAVYAAMCFVSQQVGLCEVHGATTTDTLGTARLPATVKARIYRELSNEFNPSGGVARPVVEAFDLKMIELGPDGHYGIRVWGSNRVTATVCGATGNCPIWVFDRQTGDLLLSADGWDFHVEVTIHHGRYDLLTRANMSAGTGVRDLYRFDGRTYQHIAQTDETY